MNTGLSPQEFSEQLTLPERWAVRNIQQNRKDYCFWTDGVEPEAIAALIERKLLISLPIGDTFGINDPMFTSVYEAIMRDA